MEHRALTTERSDASRPDAAELCAVSTSSPPVAQLATIGRCDFADLSQLRLSRFDGLAADWQHQMGWVPWVHPKEAAA